MAATEFVLAVVEETIQRLDNCQGDDYSSILLRLEYLNRTIINNGELPESIVAGIGLAIKCLKDEQETTHGDRAVKMFSGCPGRPSFQVSEDQLSYLVESGFTVPQISQLLEVSRRTVERRMSHFGIRISGKTEFTLHCIWLGKIHL